MRENAELWTSGEAEVISGGEARPRFEMLSVHFEVASSTQSSTLDRREGTPQRGSQIITGKTRSVRSM